MRTSAAAIADNVQIYSGHGGLVFVYDPWIKEEALDAIYAKARRFWGVDVEDMNATLSLMKKGIKGINWITLFGSEFSSSAQVSEAVGSLAAEPGVTLEARRHASVLIAGPEPVAGEVKGVACQDRGRA